MFSWLTKTLTKNIHPLLIQAYRVVAVVPITIDGTLQQLEDFGITPESPIYKTLAIVKQVATVIQDAIAKILITLGGEIPVDASSVSSMSNLEDELAKLKKMI